MLAQRPPQRLHRQLGGVDGRDDRRMIVCPAVPDGTRSRACTFGEPAGPDLRRGRGHRGRRPCARSSRARRPVYAVERAGDGCFELAQLRVEPRAPFGVDARFCFDDATGAPTDSRVRYAGGIVEVLAVTTLTGTVRDADLEP